MADVNGDGKPDLLTAHDGSSVAGVLLGTGSGTFGAVSTYSTGTASTPKSIAVADVNGDGRPDLLTANAGSNSAGVLLGTGTGSFAAVTTYSTGPGSQPNGIAVADVNGDGRPDLLTANFNSSTAGVLLGMGSGTFGAVVTYSTGPSSYPRAIAVADVNADGRPDLLTANAGSATAGVLLGTGTGSFGTASTYSTGTGGAYALAVADVNGDGRPDLLTTTPGSKAGVLLGTGAGVFNPATTYDIGTGNGAAGLAVADVNGDGKPDLLTACPTSNSAGVLLGTGTGSFGAVTTYDTGTSSRPFGIAVADVNGDGRPDLLTANFSSTTAGVLLGTTPALVTRTFLPVTSYGTGSSSPYALAVADVNGDGRPDLLTANNGTGTAGVLLATGTGSFGTASTYSTGSNSLPQALAVADVNGDGKPDLLTANNGTGTAGVLLGTGTGTFGAVTTYGTNGYPAGIAVADVNGDGKLDLLVANNGDTVGVLLGTGTGTFGSVSTYGTGTGSQPAGIAVADVNGDGKPDLLTVNAGSNTAGVLLGTGSGAFGAVSTYGTGPGSQPLGIAVADVNGDGKLDLLTANNGTGTAGVLLGTGTGSFGAVTQFSAGNNSYPLGIAVADVNGDGKLDLLTANFDSSTAGVLLGTGTGSFGPANTYSITIGSSPHSIAVADVNGDGKPDLLTANNASNTAGVLLGGLDLVVSTTTPVYADALYNSLTVTGTGIGTLAANVALAGSGGTTVQSGGVLNDGCYVLSGPGSFTLAAGGTLGICAAQGLSSSGSTGAVQVTGTRSFAPDALYTYNGNAAQVTGNGLPASVRTLTLSNSAGLALTGPITVSSAATLSTGVLTTGANALTLGPAATLGEDAGGYVTGTVQTTRALGAAGVTESFGGLGLTLTPGGSRLPGSTLVVRTTGTARPGAGTSQSVKRVFDIQPTLTSGLSVALALTVRDDERNGIAPASLRLFKSDDAGSNWQLQKAATVAATTTNGVATYTASLGGISSFSLWTLGDAANPLPVQLVDFTAQPQGSGALLRWTTASETSSARFEVESSADGVAFSKVGQVAAAGSSPQARSYAFLDDNLARYAALVVYYRLRQVDQDGKAAYSPVRTVVGGAGGLALFPNPAPGGVATLTGAAPGQVLRVLDTLGRAVATCTTDATGTAALSRLAPGLYLVRVGYEILRLAVK